MNCCAAHMQHSTAQLHRSLFGSMFTTHEDPPPRTTHTQPLYTHCTHPNNTRSLYVNTVFFRREPIFFAAQGQLWIAYSQELSNGGMQSIVWQGSHDGGKSWGYVLATPHRTCLFVCVFCVHVVCVCVCVWCVCVRGGGG
jgi:hypothetical protein